MHDILTATIAEAVAQHIDLDQLARRIADHLRDTPSASPDYHPDEPYPVTEIRNQLGKRDRPMAPLTFKKNYLDTKKLTLVTNPNDRRQLHVRRGDWEALKAQTQQKKK